jgi:hypothetical protein
MAQLFNQNSFTEDVISSINFSKANFSPMRKEFDLNDDLMEPFEVNPHNRKGNPFANPTELLWSSPNYLDSPTSKPNTSFLMMKFRPRFG